VKIVSVVFATCAPTYPVDTNDPIAHWNFDEGEGDTAYDSAGNNHGTLKGDTSWVVGQIGSYALDFDGDGDAVYLEPSIGGGSPLNIYNTDLTVSAWVKARGVGGTIVARAKWWYVTYHLGVAANEAYINTYRNGPGHWSLWTDEIISSDTWYHLVGVFERSAGTGYVYVNGAEEAQGTLGANPASNDATTKIGCRNSTSDGAFDGVIDDVRMYSRALSAEEVQQLYQGGLPAIIDVDIKPGSCPNPLNLASRGVLPVAILGREEFDVNTVDAASIMFAGVSAVRSSYEDVAAPLMDGNDCECNTAGPDGHLDLTVKFKTPQVVEQIIPLLDGLVAGDELVLTLTGALSDGTLIEGQECVVLVGNVPRALAAVKSDITEDGIVNMHDLAVLTEYWLESASIEY
jgi:hypothetical protein